jgi:HEPN domain-containing protein
MISAKELRAIARARLRDAQVLLRAKRFDGAWYLCGYAIELALKARICRTLRWSKGFPETAQDFKGLQSVKTHDLEILLKFSGVEDRVRAKRMAEWSVVLDWNPEKRYQANRLSTAQQAVHMVKCVERLLEVL